jgi:aspartate/glutamate racemase
MARIKLDRSKLASAAPHVACIERLIKYRKKSIPVLNMLEIVADVCKEQTISKIGILGTTWTMAGHLN